MSTTRALAGDEQLFLRRQATFARALGCFAKVHVTKSRIKQRFTRRPFALQFISNRDNVSFADARWTLSHSSTCRCQM
jgi:hypothetical protein